MNASFIPDVIRLWFGGDYYDPEAGEKRLLSTPEYFLAWSNTWWKQREITIDSSMGLSMSMDDMIGLMHAVGKRGRVGSHPAWTTPDGVLVTILLTTFIARRVPLNAEEKAIAEEKYYDVGKEASRFGIKKAYQNRFQHASAIMFLASPLVNSSSLDDLDSVISVYATIVSRFPALEPLFRVNESTGPLGSFTQIVKRNKDIIERFGRYPNLVSDKNDLTEAETVWLTTERNAPTQPKPSLSNFI